MIYRFGEYELDTRVYELRRGGAAHAVEPQVFDVLLYLVRNRDRVVPKEELLEQVWPDRFVSETTLTSRVKEARKAVGDTGSLQGVIRTQRGRGYRFVADVEERDDPSDSETRIPAPAAADSGADTRLDVTRFYEEFSARGVTEQSGFVGRKAELDRLATILRAALGGERQLVFVTGEAGAGKTTLVDAFLAQIPDDSPVLVARGQCVEYRGSGEAYMPLLDALSRLARDAGHRQLVPLLRSAAPSWLVQMPSLVPDEELSLLRSVSGSGGERMLRELGMMIDRLTTDTPMVLLLEDLHWSDYSTLDAIDLLAKQSEPARLMVIGTWRPSDVKAARHPVHALSRELRARGQCEVVALPPFGVEELESYMHVRFGDSPISRTLAPVLQSRTAGNALFVRNIVDSWMERKLIRDSGGGDWRLGVDLDELARDVPDTLQHLIENQIADLDPDQQRILETASVIGRSFTVALIAASLPAADDDIELECERLVRESNILRSEGTRQWGDGSLTARFAFVHDLYVDVFYERIPTVRRGRLHLQVGQALERAWNGRESQHAPELALHFQRAADREKGPRYLRLAAEQALERSAYREAVAHLDAALELIEGVPESSEKLAAELQIRCQLAPPLVATRGWTNPAVENNYLRSRQLAEELGEGNLLSQTLYGLANMYEFSGRYELAEKITNERIALDTMSTSERELESHELLTCSLLHQGRYEESVKHGEKALAGFGGIAAADLDPDLLVLVVQAYGWMSGSLHFAGRSDEALAHSARALELSSASGNEFSRASAHVQAAFVRFYRREPEICNELAGVGGSIAREFRFPFHVACARVLQGWAVAMSGGSSDEMVVEIKAGIRTSESIGARMDLPLFHAILAEVLAYGGKPEEALSAINEGLEIVDRGRTFFYVPELHRQRGVVLLEMGAKRRAEAMASFERAFALAEEQQCLLFALRAARDLSRIEAGAEWSRRLKSIFESFQQGEDTIDLREVKQMIES